MAASAVDHLLVQLRMRAHKPTKGGRGDLLLSLSLKHPASYSDQEKQLLEQLRAARSSDPRADWISAARL